MFKSYCVTFFRKLRKEKLFSLLNIGGLTVGLATVILISLFIRDELSFDQHESRKASVFLLWQEVGQNARKDSRVPYSLVQEMKEKVPAFQQVVSTKNRDVLISVAENSFYDNKAIYTTAGFSELFDINILAGSNADFEKPDVAMISEKAALKYFDKVEDAIGQLIKVDEKDSYEVTGVFEDQRPNSSLQFDFLITGEALFKTQSKRIDSKRGYYPTVNWVLLSPNYELNKIGAQTASIAKSSMFEWLYGLSQIEEPFHLLNITDVHLRSGLGSTSLNTSDIRYVYLFSVIGALVLLIAIINYTNLSTAQSIKKSKEVGLRKVVGASSNQVSQYYLMESFIIVFISSLFAFAIAERFLPYLNNLMDKEIYLNYFSFEFLIITLGTTLFIGVFAGLYPAFILSKAKPLDALNRKTSSKGKVKKILIVTQFFIAQLLIIATIIIQQQMNFIQNKNLGYDREQLIEIDIHGELPDNAKVLKSELMRIPGIDAVTLSNNIIGRQDIVFLNNENIQSDKEISVVFDFFNVDHDFLKTMEMEVLQGRGFTENDAQGIVINESAFEKFGWDGFEGKVIQAWGNEYPVIGVIRDFHNESLKSEISAGGVAIDKRVSKFLVVRVNPNDIRKTVSSMEEVWDGFETGRPLDYKFLDEDYDSKYKVEARLGKLFLSFASLAIVIALLGLIGLSTFTIEQRIKEISLRRVLGANFKQVFELFARGYLAMILVGFLIAAPIVYYGISNWLQQFVYRVEPGILEFSSALLFTGGLVLIIVCLQVIKTNRINPSDVLRNE